MVKLAKLSPLLLLFLILPVQNQLFVDDDPVDFLEAWNGHFANPVIIRGDQYDYNINSTVLFNYAMSDTKGFQNSLKSGSYALILIGIWQLLPKLGSPIPVPQRVPPIGGRGRREAGGEEGRVISQTNRLRLLVWYLTNTTLHNNTENTVRNIKQPLVL